jgi:hypothetical protein
MARRARAASVRGWPAFWRLSPTVPIISGGSPSVRPEQIEQAALYERVRFGGADLEVEKGACGLG